MAGENTSFAAPAQPLRKTEIPDSLSGCAQRSRSCARAFCCIRRLVRWATTDSFSQTASQRALRTLDFRLPLPRLDRGARPQRLVGRRRRLLGGRAQRSAHHLIDLGCTVGQLRAPAKKLRLPLRRSSPAPKDEERDGDDQQANDRSRLAPPDRAHQPLQLVSEPVTEVD